MVKHILRKQMLVVYGAPSKASLDLDPMDVFHESARESVPIQPMSTKTREYDDFRVYRIPVDGLRENEDIALNVDIDDASGATALGCSLAAMLLYLGRLRFTNTNRSSTTWSNSSTKYAFDVLSKSNSVLPRERSVDLSKISNLIKGYRDEDEVHHVYERMCEVLFPSYTSGV
jgi:hypothetical protein